jgi:hypothetical protein
MIKDFEYDYDKEINKDIDVDSEKPKYAKNSKQKNAEDWDPIKYDRNGNTESIVWTTKSLEKAVDAINKGLPLKANPFCGKNTQHLRPDLVYKRTKEELDDYIHCMNDPIYFASKCYLMTPTGLHQVELRDYQKEYINMMKDNRFTLMLSCRQSGKCLTYFNTIKIKINNSFLITYKNESEIQSKKIAYILRKYYFCIDNDNDNDNNYVIDIPLFELENMFNNSFLWNMKYQIYKTIYNIEYVRKNKTKN